MPAPDLVLLTGDFFTMEAHYSGRALQDALAPLAAMPKGRVFACLGVRRMPARLGARQRLTARSQNHDYEALELVEENLQAAGVHLLKDDAAVVDVPEVGAVQLVGFEFYFSRPEERLRAVLAKFPRHPDALRLLLLHNPSHFVYIPDGDGDLALSGHYVRCRPCL
jgi:predicted MPP superfamily phosphohydrolase